MTLQSKPQQGFLDTLPADLAALDWAGAVDTLPKLSTLLAGDLFDELGKSLSELLPRTLTVLRDQLGHCQSHTVADGDTTYARSLVRLRR